MKAMLSTAALLSSLLICADLTAADDIPHVEFVKQLRNQNLPDLAMEYLQKMQKDGTLPASMKKDFPLEMARLRMEIASTTTDVAKRGRLRAEAQKFYKEYAKANPKTAGAAEAKLEIARVSVADAKSQLTRALLEPEKERRPALLSARKQLEGGEKDLKSAYDDIRQLLILAKNARLSELKKQAELEMALNLLDQTQTYGFDGDELLARADKGKKALDMLDTLAAEDDSSPTCWKAKAWVIRANAEMDQFPQGEAAWKKYFATAKGPLAIPAKRLGHYFLVKMQSRNQQAKPEDVIGAGGEWLRTYQPFRNSPEGQEVRYLVAGALNAHAQEIEKKDKQTANVLFRQAEKAYSDLTKIDGDYAAAARRNRVALLIKLRPELTKGSLDKLKNFEDFYLRAQLEMAQLNDDFADLSKKFPKDAAKVNEEYAKKEQERQKTAVTALGKAMDLVTDEVPSTELVDAKYLYIYLLMAQQDPLKAAQQGDEVARKYPHSDRAGTSGAYALHGYSQAIEQAKKQGMKTADLETKLQSLAEYLVKTWPKSLPADAARHQLALVAYRSSKFPDAVAALQEVSEAYGSYNQAQYLLAMAALEADKANVAVPKGKPSWKELASKAYASFKAPSGPQAKDFNANYFFIYGKIEQAKVLFSNKKYDEMDKLLTSLQARIKKLDEADQEAMMARVGPMLEPLTVYSKYGRSFALMSSTKPDRYKQILSMLDNGIIQKLADGQKVGAKIDKQMEVVSIELRAATEAQDKAMIAIATKKLQALQREKQDKTLPLDPKLGQALFGFALTANLMEGKTDRAIEILGFIQNSSGGFENQGVILARVVSDIVKLVDKLKAGGNKADYERTRSQFSAFLKVLAQQPVANMKPEMVRFLGMGYSALDMHKEAIALLKQIPEPKGEDGQKFYNIIRLMIAREYRLQKDYDTAWKMLGDLERTDFGKSSLDLKKERIQWYMDKKIYGRAAGEWSSLMKAVQDTRVEEYNEALYNYIFCVYQYAATNSKLDAVKKTSYIDRAGRLIATVERNDPEMGGLKDKYLQLLKENPLLKTSFEKQKKELEKAAAEAAAKGDEK